MPRLHHPRGTPCIPASNGIACAITPPSFALSTLGYRVPFSSQREASLRRPFSAELVPRFALWQKPSPSGSLPWYNPTPFCSSPSGKSNGPTVTLAHPYAYASPLPFYITVAFGVGWDTREQLRTTSSWQPQCLGFGFWDWSRAQGL